MAFLHGIEVQELDVGPRPIRVVRSSVIGIVGTAPDANPNAFPLNQPVLVAGSRREAGKLDSVGDGRGTLPGALDGILDQAGAMTVVVRVPEGDTQDATRANVLGGENNGQLEGVHALRAAQTELDLTPRILLAPWFTHQRVQDGITGIAVDSGGNNYSPHPQITVDGDGANAEAVAKVDFNGVITSINVTDPGAGYTGTPTVLIDDPGGSNAQAVAQVGNGSVTGVDITNEGDGLYSLNTTVSIEDHTVVQADDLSSLDPDGDSTDEWTAGTNWTHDAANNLFKHSSGTAGDLTRTWEGLTTGERYTTVVTIAGMTSGTLTVTFGGATQSITADGTYRITGDAAATTEDVVMSATSGFNGSVTFAELQNAPETEAALSVTVQGGHVTDVTVDAAGSGYGNNVQITFSDAGGTGAAATASVGPARNAVVSELLGIANRMRSIIVADGPDVDDQEAINYAKDFGSKRVYVHDPWDRVISGQSTTKRPPSPRVAGIIARTDQEKGWHVSPSNELAFGIVGTTRPVDWKFGDNNSRANLLNENEVTTTIRQDGFRLWGNRTTSSDPKWAFINVVRTNDIIADSIVRAHLWAVDRNITATYLEDVTEGVNAFMGELKARGVIAGGRAWPDPELNTPDAFQKGKVYINYEFSPFYPAEHIIFRAMLTNDFLEEIVPEGEAA